MNTDQNSEQLHSSSTKIPPISAAKMAPMAKIQAKTSSPKISPAIPWWLYFTAGALAGWLAKGRVTWIVGAAAAVHYLNRARNRNEGRAAMKKKVAQIKSTAAAPVPGTGPAPTIPREGFTSFEYWQGKGGEE